MSRFLQGIWHHVTNDALSWKESIGSIWHCWYFKNLIVVVIVLVLLRTTQRLAQKDYWRLAFRHVFRRRGVRIHCRNLLFQIEGGKGRSPVAANHFQEEIWHLLRGKRYVRCAKADLHRIRTMGTYQDL